jgi:hypothetical protein
LLPHLRHLFTSPRLLEMTLICSRFAIVRPARSEGVGGLEITVEQADPYRGLKSGHGSDPAQQAIVVADINAAPDPIPPPYRLLRRTSSKYCTRSCISFLDLEFERRGTVPS